MTTASPMAPTAVGLVVPARTVRLGDGLLGRWQTRNRERTIPHGILHLNTDGALDNLRRLRGEVDAPFRGPVFMDSDVHKTLEAVAWELGHGENALLRSFYEDTLALLIDVQDADGYLDSAFQRADREQERWTDFAGGHEMYCAGHLIQAAVASARALGDDRLLAVAARLADLIVRLFGDAGSDAYPGHPEIESALVELYRLTGQAGYLETARAFIDRRGSGRLGRGAFGPAYFQDDAPVRDTEVMRGHAVRALYLNAGVTDVYLETGDQTLLRAMEAQWDDMISHRTYLTGGTGSRHRDEAFGDAYELPPDRAYAETCAGIAAMQWAWRMYVATGRARYADFIETALYNVVADGVSADGVSFFYSNPLQLRADHVSVQEEAAASRLDWYFCACCPPNIMRTFASLEATIASTAGREVQLAQYTRARVETIVGESPVVIDVDTDYPAEGVVRVTVIEGAGDATLALRLPGWCRRWQVEVDGEIVEAVAAEGWIRLSGALTSGTVVVLHLDLTPDLLRGNARIDAIRGAVAVRRGPVVYCAEQADNAVDVELAGLSPAGGVVVTNVETPLGPVLELPGVVHQAEAGLYAAWRDPAAADARPVTLRMRPYATWGNGTPGAMRVWIPAVTTGDPLGADEGCHAARRR